MKRSLLVLGLIAASGALIADELILDYEFADGEIASGAEVNANFQALEGKANEQIVDATYNIACQPASLPACWALICASEVSSQLLIRGCLRVFPA